MKEITNFIFFFILILISKSTEYLVLSTRYSVSGTQYQVLSTWTLVPGTQYPGLVDPIEFDFSIHENFPKKKKWYSPVRIEQESTLLLYFEYVPKCSWMSQRECFDIFIDINRSIFTKWKIIFSYGVFFFFQC